MENEKRRMQGVWNPSVSRTAHIKRKCPAPPDVLISESSFVCQLWSANTAPWMHPRQSRVVSFLDWDHKALPIEDTTKAPSPDEAFYFQISILSLFSQQDISRCNFNDATDMRNIFFAFCLQWILPLPEALWIFPSIFCNLEEDIWVHQRRHLSFCPFY